MVVPKIVVSPPGPRAREVLRRDKEIISQSYGRYYPLVVKRIEGCIIEDVDGNKYIDFNSGLGVLVLGGAHKDVLGAIQSQSKKLIHYSCTDFYYSEIVELAEEVCRITPGSFPKRVFYGNSGTEAVEAALKSVRWHTGKPRVIAFIGAFHGRTMGSLSLTASKPVHRKGFFPLIPGVTHVPYPYCYRCPFGLEKDDCNYYCVEFIDEWVLKKFVPPEEVSAIIFEPIQGEGGYIVPPDGYFKKLKRLADENGFLLIDDEIQAGMGRTGKWWAIEHYGVEPDLLCIAKGIAAGLPLGLTVSRRELMSWEAGSHASTFGGNALSCRVALTVIRVIERERLLDNALRLGNYILKRLNEFKEEYRLVGDVRGKGLMIGMELVRDRETKEPASQEAKEIISECFKRGLAIISCGVSTVRIFPPLIITEDLVEKGLNILEDVIKSKDREPS